MIRITSTLLVLLLAACSPEPRLRPSAALEDQLGYGLPSGPVGSLRQAQASGFARYVLDAVASFGGGTYQWKGDGVTRELRYQGSVIATPYGANLCHCVGATIQVYVSAFEAYDAAVNGSSGSLAGLSLADVKQLKKLWYVATPAEEGVQIALKTYALGTVVTNKELAKPGDFAQIWRNSGSGHSVVFDSWQRDGSGAISGIRYFSCNSGGPGFQTEPIGSGSKDVVSSRIYIVRASYPGPAPQADAGAGGDTQAPLPVDLGAPSADSAAVTPADAGSPQPDLAGSAPNADLGPSQRAHNSDGCAVASTGNAEALPLGLLLLALALVARRRRR
jgi:MYXO-CTERM domain-containing protein